MAEKLTKLPYELQLALRTIVSLENQRLIFILYPDKKLTDDEIKEQMKTPCPWTGPMPPSAEISLRECINGLWVTGFYEGGFEDHQKFYELTPFGRRLLKGTLDALYVVEEGS